MDYTEYPQTIKESYYYFLRTRNDLHLRVFQVKQVRNNHIHGILEFRKEMVVQKTDLIDFNPKSRFFRYTMRISTFKNNSFIKKALYKFKYSLQDEEVEIIYDRRVTYLMKYKRKRAVMEQDAQREINQGTNAYDATTQRNDAHGFKTLNCDVSDLHTGQLNTKNLYAEISGTNNLNNKNEMNKPNDLNKQDVQTKKEKLQYVKGKFNKKIRIIDSELSLEEFERAYSKYVLNDEKYIPDTEKNSSNIIVPGTKEINIYSLYKTISMNGGMENVTNEQKWKSLFFKLMRKTNVSYTVRTFYKKFLYEFEQIRKDQLRIECECKNLCDCDDYVNTNNFKSNCPFNFNYKYSIGEIVVLYTINEKYYGHIKLRRNRGLNQYYIQFLGWCKEYSEWLCEDVLSKSDNNEHYVAKRPSRSSKSNNLVNDPLIREKHSHNKNEANKYNLPLDGRHTGNLPLDGRHSDDIGPYKNRMYQTNYKDRMFIQPNGKHGQPSKTHAQHNGTNTHSNDIHNQLYGKNPNNLKTHNHRNYPNGRISNDAQWERIKKFTSPRTLEQETPYRQDMSYKMKKDIYGIDTEQSRPKQNMSLTLKYDLPIQQTKMSSIKYDTQMKQDVFQIDEEMTCKDIRNNKLRQMDIDRKGNYVTYKKLKPDSNNKDISDQIKKKDHKNMDGEIKDSINGKIVDISDEMNIRNNFDHLHKKIDHSNRNMDHSNRHMDRDENVSNSPLNSISPDMSHNKKTSAFLVDIDTAQLDQSEIDDHRDAKRLLSFQKDDKFESPIKNLNDDQFNYLINNDNRKIVTRPQRKMAKQNNSDNKRYLDRRMATPFREENINRYGEYFYRNSPTFGNSTHREGFYTDQRENYPRENLLRENTFQGQREHHPRDQREILMREGTYRDNPEIIYRSNLEKLGNNKYLQHRMNVGYRENNYSRDSNHTRDINHTRDVNYNREYHMSGYNREMGNHVNKQSHRVSPSSLREKSKKDLSFTQEDRARLELFSKKQSKIDFFESKRNLLLNPALIEFVKNEKILLSQQENKNKSRRELLKELYSIDGKDECIMNIHNYMIISYFKELR